MMTRKDLDKAHLHGFDRARIRDFMTEGVIGISSEASIDEAHRLMATYSFERLPVLKSGRLVGILTRADLVRALYRSFQPSGETDARSGFLWMEGVAPLMESSFSPRILDLLHRIGARAETMGMKAAADLAAVGEGTKFYIVSVCNMVSAMSNFDQVSIAEGCLTSKLSKIKILNHLKKLSDG